MYVNVWFVEHFVNVWFVKQQRWSLPARKLLKHQTDFSSGWYFLLQMRNPAIETAQKLYENAQLRPSIEVRK